MSYTLHIAPHNIKWMNIHEPILKMEHYIGCANLVKFCEANYVCLIGSPNRENENPIKLILYAAQSLSQHIVEYWNGTVNPERTTLKTTHEYILAVSSTGNRLPLVLKRMKENASFKIR